MRMHAIALGLFATAAVALDCSSTTPATGEPDGGEGGAGSGSGGGSGGSTGEAGIVPDAFIAATVGVGPSSPSTLCNVGSSTPGLDVGVPVNGKPITVLDGSQQAGSAVRVSCTVAPSGGGFDVSLEVSVDGPSGGDVTIISPGGAGAVTLSGGAGIAGSFTSNSSGTYSQGDCTITFTYLGSSVATTPAVAPGRIWGHLSCPAAQASGETVLSPDGGIHNVQCDAEADFLFEQCGQ